MTLDATMREANLRDSVKKYFVDNLVTGQGVQITFDRGLSSPVVQGTEVDRWISFNFGEMYPDQLYSQAMTIFCCTKKDAEGFKLAQLRDKLMDYLFDTTMPDGNARIIFYRSSASEAWTVIGGIVILLDLESAQMLAEDGTKFKAIDIRLKWGAKC